MVRKRRGRQRGRVAVSEAGLSAYNHSIHPALGFMAVIEIRNLEKSYRVYQKQEGLRAALTGLFNRAVSRRRSGARHRPRRRGGRVRRLSGSQRRGQNHDAQAALRRDQSDGGHGAGDGLCAVGARERLSAPVRAGDGAEEPAVVGPAGGGVVPAASADLCDRPEQLSANARRARGSARCAAAA